MANATETETLREIARQAVIEQADECERLAHTRNYHTLHVHRDGTVSWFEGASQSEDIIDSQARDFRAVESVASVGTGSYSCNCDYCNEVYDADEERQALEDGEEYDKDAKYKTVEDAIYDACCDSGAVTERERQMLNALDAIEVGYFDDEEEEVEG